MITIPDVNPRGLTPLLSSHRKTIVVASFALLVITSIYYFYNSSDPADLTERNHEEATDFHRTAVMSMQEGVTKNAKPHLRESIVSATELKPLPGLQFQIQAFLRDKEAHRCKMLSTTRHGAETWYLLGVDPPSIDEIKEVRGMIAELQRQVAHKERQRFEVWIQDMIDAYDPFGVEGRKGMLIKIPDDPKAAISGCTFSTVDFNADIERFDPKNGNVHSFENYRGYHRDDHIIPERFETLIQP